MTAFHAGDVVRWRGVTEAAGKIGEVPAEQAAQRAEQHPDRGEMIPHTVCRAENHESKSQGGNPIQPAPLRKKPNDSQPYKPTRGIGQAGLRKSIGKRGCSKNYTGNESNESQFNLIWRRVRRYELQDTQYAVRSICSVLLTAYCVKIQAGDLTSASQPDRTALPHPTPTLESPRVEFFARAPLVPRE